MATAVPSAGSERTLPLNVDKVGFLLNRMGEDCSPLQFLRELTQNAIEAVQRTEEKTGEIVWDVEWGRFDLDGPPYKLCIIDTGDGMTGPEMVKYINQLSSSIAEQSFEGNYGVGAKIAAATLNHAGLVYFSWKSGSGSMIHLWRDPDSGEYGLRQFDVEGQYRHWAPIEDSLKPPQIAEHGTMVVLLGNQHDEDTMKAPAEAESPSRWIAKYLNQRYFSFPDGIEVRAREGWEYERSDSDRNLLRRVTGQEEYLDAHAEASGTVPLQDASAHWWILKDEKALSQNSGSFASAGHSAALYQNELYEMDSGRSGSARLQRFGVYFGYRRVVIYVEPDVEGDVSITTDTARTQLRVNRKPLPWHEWETEFRENMPEEITALVEKYAGETESKEHEQAIKDRLRQIKDLFKLSRFRPLPSGEFSVSSDDKRRGRPASAGSSSAGGGGKPGGSGGRAGDVYALFVTDKGQPMSPVDVDPFPTWRWISIKDGSRAPGFLEDRAAKYIPEGNLLQINADFRVFRDMVDYWTKQYKDVPGAITVIEEAVKQWFEQALVETVMGLQALEGTSPEWNAQHIETAMSPEGLTTAVMQRYHVVNSVRRTLGAQLGSLKDKAG